MVGIRLCAVKLTSISVLTSAHGHDGGHGRKAASTGGIGHGQCERVMMRLASPRTSRATDRVISTLALVALAVSAVTGCTRSGVGTGTSNTGAVSATFTWKAASALQGTMTARLNTGETYQGPFVQITRDTTVDELAPLWVGWEGAWAGPWGVWRPGEAFLIDYTGKVVANLAGPRGYTRCRFNLLHPSRGMAGGGEGRCQLPDGTIIRAEFPPS
jgi:hypothetical protein